MTFDLDDLERIGKAATAGPWELVTQFANSREDAHAGIMAGEDGWIVVDTFNSELRTIHEEHDEDGGHYWDEPGKINCSFIVAARNHWQAMIDEIRRLRAESQEVLKTVIAGETESGQYDSVNGLMAALTRSELDELREEVDRLRAEVAKLKSHESPIGCTLGPMPTGRLEIVDSEGKQRPAATTKTSEPLH